MSDTADRLRAVALAATPGPWEWDDKGLWSHPKGAGWACVIVANYEYDTGVTLDYTDRDADYIAAASPDVILALLDELDTLRDEAERLRLRISNDAIRLRAAADAGEF
jgi:hypothetical protein